MTIIGTIELNERGAQSLPEETQALLEVLDAAGVRTKFGSGRATFEGALENVLAAIGVMYRVSPAAHFSVRVETIREPIAS